MKAIRLHAPMDLRIDEIDDPQCGPKLVKLKIECCGLCGSDRPRVLDGDVPFYPNTLGHEIAAKVVQIGEGVTTVEPGDHATVAPLIVCHQCEHCKNGNFGSCINSKFIGLRVKDVGGFAQYLVLPESNIIKLPEGMDRITAVFVEPISVAIHALFRADLKPGSDIAVIGCGTIGQLIIQCAKLMGAKRVFAFDINENQLNIAKKLGADFCYNNSEKDFIKKYLEDCGGYGCPYVIEAVGVEPTIRLSLDIAKVKANVVLVGNLGKPVTFTREYTRMILVKELSWKGSWLNYDLNYPGDAWRLSVYYLSTGKINIKPLIYKVGPSRQVLKMFEEWQDISKVKGKMIITFDDL